MKLPNIIYILSHLGLSGVPLPFSAGARLIRASGAFVRLNGRTNLTP
jgi:hypothetical protein